MARIRNPRFAPEFLESRLNPSTVIPAVSFADVAVMLSETNEPVKDPEAPLERDGNYNPIPDPAPFLTPGLTFPV